MNGNCRRCRFRNGCWADPEDPADLAVPEDLVGLVAQVVLEALAAAAEVWDKYGIRLEPDGARCICSLFCYHDSTKGEALSRRPQKPFADLAVWSAFGGRGVITPEMAGGHGMRLTRITESDLLPGDILVTAKDGFGGGAESRLWDGRQFAGSDPEHSHTRLESLFGRFVWVLLRPSQGL